jgi:hypothetical protein
MSQLVAATSMLSSAVLETDAPSLAWAKEPTPDTMHTA